MTTERALLRKGSVGRAALVLAAAFAAALGTPLVLPAQDRTDADQPPATQPAAKTEADKPPSSQPASKTDGGPDARQTDASAVPDPKQVGGEPDSIVQVANLIYAGVQSSRCFADHFLIRAEKESAISTSRRFHAVKLGSGELFDYPLVIMTGEGDFTLPDGERENLRQYVERGGFLLASAGCSSQNWDRAFRREMAQVFPACKLQTIGMEHPVFNTVYPIKELRAKHGQPRPLEGITIGGRLGALYAPDGLNDTAHTTGCCCCGGNELTNAEEINVNILAYALLY